MKQQFVHIKNRQLYDHYGRPFILEGVGLNAWLLPEGYMFKSYDRIDRPQRFYDFTQKLLGKEASNQFWIDFRKNFITIDDIKHIKAYGFNSVRIPFDYQLFFEPSETQKNLIVKKEGFDLLDQVILWCKAYELYVILDLHAAPGGQTGANIDNSISDQPLLFTRDLYIEQTIYIWHYIAQRYKDEPWIACYDLLNEPLPEWFSMYHKEIIPLYKKIIKAIRSVDENHVISVEGAHWATDFSIFEEKLDDQIFPQFHKYWSPIEIEGIASYLKLSKDWNVPLFMGEGGEHFLMWYSGAFKMYRQLNISWNFWSYKKMDTHNSMCSFSEPKLWQTLLKESSTMTKKDIDDTFSALLDAVKFKNCILHEDVINHLFQRNTFETMGITFDFNKDALTDIDAYLNPLKHRLRGVDGLICLDSHGHEMLPDFKIRKDPEINTEFPYAKLEVHKPYTYAFNVSKSYQMYEIVITHKHSLDVSVYINHIDVSHQLKHSEEKIIVNINLKYGKHSLSIVTHQKGSLKKISFKAIKSA